MLTTYWNSAIPLDMNSYFPWRIAGGGAGVPLYSLQDNFLSARSIAPTSGGDTRDLSRRLKMFFFTFPISKERSNLPISNILFTQRGRTLQSWPWFVWVCVGWYEVVCGVVPNIPANISVSSIYSDHCTVLLSTLCTQGDWKFAAMVLDRMCLIIFSLFTGIATVTTLAVAPHVIVWWKGENIFPKSKIYFVKIWY